MTELAEAIEAAERALHDVRAGEGGGHYNEESVLWICGKEAPFRVKHVRALTLALRTRSTQEGDDNVRT